MAIIRCSVFEGRRESWLPAVDVFDTAQAVVVKAELAGMAAENVDEDRYYRIEHRFGSFERSLALPRGVRPDDIQATYENGVLEVTVPKAEAEKPHKIEVKTGKKTIEAKKAA